MNLVLDVVKASRNLHSEATFRSVLLATPTDRTAGGDLGVVYGPHLYRVRSVPTRCDAAAMYRARVKRRAQLGIPMLLQVEVLVRDREKWAPGPHPAYNTSHRVFNATVVRDGVQYAYRTTITVATEYAIHKDNEPCTPKRYGPVV